MAEYNRYYRHFLTQIGGGEVEVPELGEIYRYNSPLRKGGGHLFHARIRQRKGLGFGSLIASLYQRAKPLLKVLGTQAVNVISGIAKDTISGQNIKDATVRNIAKALPPGLVPVTTSDSTTNQNATPPLDSTLPSRKRSKQRTELKVKQQRRRRGQGLSEIYPGLEYL